jgi:fluoroquinolone resistance protein
MQETYIQDKTYDQNDFTDDPLATGEYDNCIFNNCNFSNNDLSQFRFIDCVFNGCNLSLVKLHKTVFRDIQFRDCKMLGLRFDDCSDFGLAFSFDSCQLNHSSFYKTRSKRRFLKTLHYRKQILPNAISAMPCLITAT